MLHPSPHRKDKSSPTSKRFWFFRVLAASRPALPIVLLVVLWFFAPSGKPPQLPAKPAPAQPTPPPAKNRIVIGPDLAAKAFAATDPAVKKQEWGKVLQTCQPVALALEARMQVEEDVQKRMALKLVLHNPLWLQTLATAKLGRDAQPLFAKFLRLYSRDLQPKDIAAVRYEQVLNLEDLTPETPGAERRKFTLRAVDILEEGKKAIEVTADEFGSQAATLRRSIPGTLGEVYTRLVYDKGRNYLQEARDNLKAAEAFARAAPKDEQAKTRVIAAQQALTEVEVHAKAAAENLTLAAVRIRANPRFSRDPRSLNSVLKIQATLLEAQGKKAEAAAVRAEIRPVEASSKK